MKQCETKPGPGSVAAGAECNSRLLVMVATSVTVQFPVRIQQAPVSDFGSSSSSDGKLARLSFARQSILRPGRPDALDLHEK